MSEFTEHMRGLLAGTTSVTDRILLRLRKPLEDRLKLHSLLPVVNKQFGLSSSKQDTQQVLEDLTLDAYYELFDPRSSNFAYFRKQVEAGNQIEGLVFKELDRFVTRVHSKTFPETEGLYKNVIAAGRLLLRTRQYEVFEIGPNPKRVGISHLIGPRWSEPPEVAVGPVKDAIASSVKWSPAVRIARMHCQEAAIGIANGTHELFSRRDESEVPLHPLRLATLKSALLELAPPIKLESRETDDDFPNRGESSIISRTDSENDPYEALLGISEQEVQRKLQAIDQSPWQARTRANMRRIIETLVTRQRELGGAGAGKFSEAELARQLNLSRSTVNDTLAKLKKLV